MVKNTLDTADGSLSQVQSKRSGETFRTFANGFDYNAAGAVTAMKLGNGRWENTTFNSRLQPTQIGLGAGAYSQSLLKLEYSYGTTTNNGNVVEQKITVPGVTNPFVQAYTYDELNRLKSATETQNSTQTWKQTFTFDRYGNRNFDEANTTFAGFDKLCSGNTVLCADLKKRLNPSINMGRMGSVMQYCNCLLIHLSYLRPNAYAKKNSYRDRGRTLSRYHSRQRAQGAVETFFEISRDEICGRSKAPRTVQAKEMLILCGHRHGASLAELARLTGLNSSTVARRLESARTSHRDNDNRRELASQVMTSYQNKRIAQLHD